MKPPRPTASLREIPADICRALFDQDSDGVVVCNGDGVITEANPAACTLLGQTRDQLLTRVFITFFPEGAPGADRLPPAGRQALPGTPGHTRFVELGITRLSDTQVVCRLRPAADESTPDSRHDESMLRAAIETMADGILIVSASGRVTHFNRRFLEIWSIPPDHPATLHRNDAALIAVASEHLPDPAAFAERITEIYRSTERIEDFVQLNDGRVLERISFPLPQANDQEAVRVWQFRDITARKREEAAAAKRIEAFTQPGAGTGHISFEELFDLAEIQQIQDQFARATGVASIITQTDGTPITRPSNFCRLCIDVIRQTPVGRTNCQCSDAIIGRHHPGGPIIQHCMSGGLWDAGASLTVNGRHIANWLIGQVRDSTQSEERMRAYARTIGANEAQLIAAFREVPTMPQEQFRRVAQALYTLANHLSKTAYQNLQQARHLAGRKQAEERLRESEHRFRSMFEDNRAVMLLINPDSGGIADANPAAAEFYGYPRDQLCRMHIGEINTLPPDQIRDKLRLALGGRHEQYIFSHRLASREIRTVAVRASVVEVGGQRLIFSIIQDITERRWAEEQLHRTTQWLLHTQRISQVGGWTINPTTKVVWVSPEARRIYGIPREAETTLEYIRAFPLPQYRPILDRAFKKLLEEGKPYDLEFQIRRGTDGATVDIHSVAEFDVTEGAVLGVIQDVTARNCAEQERLELERRLLHSQKLESLGVLAGGIAHDFNNLLMAILANLELARMDLPADSPVQESIEQGITASRRAADLTQQMLNYSGKGSFAVQRLDLSSLVTENAHLFRACITHLIKLEVETTANPPPIMADPGQIQQVVMNLITNASEAIGNQPGVIHLRTSVADLTDDDLRASRANVTPSAGRYVVLEVSDTGCGMDEVTKQRLFDPFFTTKFTGRGLGMSAILGIVSAHQGAILVDSNVGQGSVIRVLFPVRVAPAEPEPVEPVLPPAGQPQSGTILVVDDDDSVRGACKRMLTKQGWRVLEAVDGPQGLELFRHHVNEVTCVILDLTMPSMSGVDVFRAMRRIRSDLRIILTSGYSNDESTSAQLANEGLAAFIQKPFSAQSLLQALAQALQTD